MAIHQALQNTAAEAEENFRSFYPSVGRRTAPGMIMGWTVNFIKAWFLRGKKGGEDGIDYHIDRSIERMGGEWKKDNAWDEFIRLVATYLMSRRDLERLDKLNEKLGEL